MANIVVTDMVCADCRVSFTDLILFNVDSVAAKKTTINASNAMKTSNAEVGAGRASTVGRHSDLYRILRNKYD